MKKILSLTAFVLPVAVTIPILAQECSHCCTGHTGQYEIFLQVEVTVPVSVKNLETGSLAWNAPVTPAFHPLENCNWIATTQGTPGADAFLDDNTLYEIKIGNNVFTYFDCEGHNTATEGFYCPNGAATYKDLFLYQTALGHTYVIPDFLKDYGDYDGAFVDDYWLLPHHSDLYCPLGSSGCQIAADDIGFLVTPQLGPSYALTAAGSYWNGLYFGSGSSGTVTSSSILKVGGGPGNSALSMYNAAPTIGYSTIQPNYGYLNYGVTLTGSNYTPLIHDSYLSTGYAPVVYVSGSNNQMNLHENNIDQPYSQPAVAAVSSGRSYFWGGPGVYPGYNEIRGGRLLATSSAVIDAGNGPFTKSLNHFCDSNASSLEADAGGVIYARHNYWSNNQDPVQNNHSGSGTIYYSNKLGASSCSGFEAVAKTSAFESEAGDEGDPLLFDARYLISRGSYQEGYALLQAVIESGSRRDARAALLEVGALYPLMKTPEVRSLASDFAATSGDLQLAGRQVLAGMYVVDGRLDFAREEYERITASRDVDRRSILDANVSIASLLISQNHYDEAKQILAALEPVGEEEAAEIALWNEILRIEDENYTAEVLLELDRLARLGKADGASSDGQEVASVDVYPNPFNPTTTIRYSVPIEGPVTIDVFDALGRRVTTLVRSVQATGTHQVVFDAAGLPTGMYLYRIETAAGVVFGKMLLAK